MINNLIEINLSTWKFKIVVICSNCGLNAKRYDLRDFKRWLKETNQFPPYDLQGMGLSYNWNFLHLYMRDDARDTNCRFDYPHEINDLFRRGKKNSNQPFIWGDQIEKVREWIDIWEMEKNLTLEKENLELSKRVKELESKLENYRENFEDFIDRSSEWSKKTREEFDQRIIEKDERIAELESLLKDKETIDLNDKLQDLDDKFEEKFNIRIEEIYRIV